MVVFSACDTDQGRIMEDGVLGDRDPSLREDETQASRKIPKTLKK